MQLNEAATRALHIDPQLNAAEWPLRDRSLVRFEVPVDGYDAEPWNGVTDYCLYDASGNVLAVVEAKRCSRNAREADEQLRHYVTEIAKNQPFAPFGFMANGHDIWFWEVGLANPRLVAGFFAPADLERLKFLLVMSIRATVGTIAVLPESLDGANLTQGTARIAPGPEVDKLFLLWQIRMPEAQWWISQQIKGSTFLEITLGRLREMPVFVPPLRHQQKFAALVQRVERLRAVQREALRQAEHLFASLLDRAFSADC